MTYIDRMVYIKNQVRMYTESAVVHSLMSLGSTLLAAWELWFTVSIWGRDAILSHYNGMVSNTVKVVYTIRHILPTRCTVVYTHDFNER